MSLTLLRATFRRNWILLLIFIGVSCLYMGVMITMFHPEDMTALNDLMQVFPPGFQDAFGFSSRISDLTSFWASWLYGMLLLGLPMVYCIILSGRLVSKMVDNGSFAYLVSTPHSRAKIIVTQGVYALVSIFVLFAFVFGAGVFFCEANHPGLLEIGQFLRLNAATMLVNMAAMMICFFCSCVLTDAKLSGGLGAGIPIAFLLMNMLGSASKDAAILKDYTIYGLYDPVALVGGLDVTGPVAIYLAIVVVLFAASIVIFRKKQLPL